MTIKNKYRVPKSQWKKWNFIAQRVFNTVYSEIYDLAEKEFFFHPKMPPPKQVEYKTVAWNAAWIAADALKFIG